MSSCTAHISAAGVSPLIVELRLTRRTVEAEMLPKWNGVATNRCLWMSVARFRFVPVSTSLVPALQIPLAFRMSWDQSHKKRIVSNCLYCVKSRVSYTVGQACEIRDASGRD